AAGHRRSWGLPVDDLAARVGLWRPHLVCSSKSPLLLPSRSGSSPGEVTTLGGTAKSAVVGYRVRRQRNRLIGTPVRHLPAQHREWTRSPWASRRPPPSLT